MTARYGFAVRPRGVSDAEWAVALWSCREYVRWLAVVDHAIASRVASGMTGDGELTALASRAGLSGDELADVEAEDRRAIMADRLRTLGGA